MTDAPHQKRDSRAVVQLSEALWKQGYLVRFRANGRSMQPNILEGDAVVVAPAAPEAVRCGEIVFLDSPDGLRVHRVVEGDGAGKSLVTRGDAGQESDPAGARLLGKVISIESGWQNVSATGTAARWRHAVRRQRRRLRLAIERRTNHWRGTLLAAATLISLLFFLQAPSAVAQTTLSLTDTANPTSTSAGNNIVYTQVLRNTGANRATPNIVLTETLPASVTFVSMPSVSGFTCANAAGVVTCTRTTNWNVASVATFTLTVTVNNNVTSGPIPNNVSASAANAPQVNASAPVSIQPAVLTLTNAAAPNPIAPGDTLTFTVVLSNSSGFTATPNLTVSLLDPVNTAFVSAAKSSGTGTWTCADVAGTATCTDTANYASGSTTNFSFVYTVNAATVNGTVLSSTASAQAANTTSAVTAGANSMVQTPDLAVSNSGAPNPVGSGGTITYTQVVTNGGSDEAVGASLTQTTPANTTFTSATPPAGWTCGTLPAVGGTGTITCSANAGTVIAAAGTATLTVVVTVNPGTGVAGAIITDTVTVSETGTDPNSANNSASSSVQVSSADLALTQAVSPSVVVPGGTITYTETVTNLGPSAAVGVTLYQQTPPNTTFASATPPAGWTCGTKPAVGATGQIICTDNTNLASGAPTVTFMIAVTVNPGPAPAAPVAGTTIVNYADLTSQTADANVSNNSTLTSALVETAAQADLAVSASASPTPVFIDSTLTYTIQVQNRGLVATTGTTLTDTLPAGVAFVSATTSQGTCSQSSGTVTCPLGSVAYPLGAPITVTIQVTTGATATTLSDTASVSSTSPADPVAANNSTTVMTVVQPLVCATPGKDGAGGTLSAVVNAYYPPGAGVTSASAGAKSVVLGAASGAATPISAGDLLLFIQMQGASINSTNSGVYGDGLPGDPGSGSTVLNNTGQYEFVTATNATPVPVGGGTLTFIGTGAGGGLLNSYTNTVAIATQGKTTFQVIRVPQYTSATLATGAGALGWTGAVGGVLALDVTSQLTLSGTVSLDGQGFRGGGGRILTGGAGAATDYVTLSTNNANGSKGEGIAGIPAYVAPAQSTIVTSTTATATGQTYVEGIPAGSYARGAPGNAGGGATDADPPVNDQNSGGGGGGNGGPGGTGGFGWNSAGIVGGFGGTAFPATTGTMVMGGGGGAGTTNNGAYWNPLTVSGNANCGANCTGIFSSGGPGGGIVIIRAGSVTGTGTISSNGLTALQVENDGGGGGGAGGTILMLANSGTLAGLTVQINGGGGGVTWPETAPGAFPGNRHGPGGGGGGGVALLSANPAGLSISGGLPGYSTISDDAYGATPGLNGVSNSSLTITQTPGTQSGAYCAGADLAVTNTPAPTLVLPGNTITYTQTVTNSGPFDAVNATFSEAIPANTSLQSVTPSGAGAAGWNCTTIGAINCSNPDVPFGAPGTTTFTVVVQVAGGTPSGTQIIDTVSVASGTQDPNLANNSATAIVIVAGAATSDLSLTQIASPNPVLAGGSITYTIVVTNNGPAAATSVAYTEPIPSAPGYATYASSTCPGGWTCAHPAVGGTGTINDTIPTLGSGASASFTLVLTVGAATPSGSIISETATVASNVSDPTSENNTVTSSVVVATTGQYDLSVASAALPNPVLPGGNISYTQSLSNAGPASPSSVVFTGSVPANTTFVSLGIPAGWICTALPAVGGTGAISCCPGSGASCSGAAVAPGTNVSFPMVVTVNNSAAPGSTISNTISVAPTVSDVVTSNNSATSTTVVASPSQADVSIVKSASPEPVDQGTNLTYLLQVTNNGPAVAQGVTVSDPLPTQVTFTSVSTTQGTCLQSAGTVTCTLGNVAVGSVVTLTINVNAATFSDVSLATNTATVSSTTSDPNSANNSSTVNSTIQAPTAVQLSDFRAALLADGGVLVEWRTKEEIRNLGFHLYREDGSGRHRLDPSLIAGSALQLRGGRPQHAAKTYQWADPDGTAQSTYWVEDVDLNGTRTMHGPAYVDAASFSAPLGAQAVRRAPLLAQLNASAAAAAPADALRQFSTGRPRLFTLPRGTILSSTTAISSAELDGMSAAKISVSQEGWYVVTAAQLAAAGFDTRADSRLLQLYAEGVEQPMIVTSSNGSLGPNGSLAFYGTGIDTPFSGARVYWLVAGRRTGARIQTLPGPVNAVARATSYSATTVLEQRTTYFAALLNGDNNDNFFGAVINGDPVDQPLTVAHSDPPSDLPVTLDVTLQGASDQQPHAVSVAFNGSTVGEMVFANLANVTNSFPLDRSLLQDGTNTVTLTALDGDNDVSLVQSIVLHYPHAYMADSNWLRFTAPAGEPLHLGGFTNNRITVLDVTDPTAVAQLSGRPIADPSGYGITVMPPGRNGAERTLLAFTDDQDSVPDSLAYHPPSYMAEPQDGASYLVIAHPDFVASVGPLMQLHQSQGDRAEVVTTDQIFDAFNYGERSPFAVRDFLRLASTRWRVAPLAVLLVGDASLDPRNYLGMGDLDFVPTRIIETQAFKTASDDWFSDFKGTGFATIPTGRIPADTPDQAALAVAKIVKYESGQSAGDWQQQAAVVADENVGENFTAAAQAAGNALPPALSVIKIFADGQDPATAREQVVAAINNGTLLLDYSGHGAVDQWSFDDIFDNPTASSLQNGDRLPVFLLMDCLNGFFQDVYSTSLAESLLFAPQGGGAAVWASSGFTGAAPQATMNQAFLKTLTANPTMPIGQAIIQAKSGISDEDVRRTWILFGDPAMHISLPAAANPQNKHR